MDTTQNLMKLAYGSLAAGGCDATEAVTRSLKILQFVQKEGFDQAYEDFSEVERTCSI